MFRETQNRKFRFSFAISLIARLSLFLIFILPTQFVMGEDQPITQNAVLEKCELELVNNDIESRYLDIQKNLEQDYNQGLPKQLKMDLVEMRKEIDKLTLESFDLESRDTQEMNSLAHKTIDKLEKMISLIPKASQLAPQVRTQYVVPFTNINSIKAEHQECLMKLAIDDVKKNTELKSNESSENIYKKLTSELNQLNDNLYRLETTDLEKFIGLRSQLLLSLESYNKDQKGAQQLTQNIPQVLNSLQSEIERLLPGLELSKGYLSLVD